MDQKNEKLLCPLCNNSEHEVLFAARDADRLRAKPFEVVRCTTCKLVATRPFLNDEALSIWYRPRYHGWWKGKKWHPFSFITKIFQKNRLKYISQHMTDAIRLIDIGCGDGTFIEYMESCGFEVYGIENPELFPQSAEQFLDVDLNRQTGDSELSRKGFRADIVTLWHALEHVSDPLSLLRQAHRALKPSGLLIISSPNFESIQSTLCSGKWFHLDLPRHRWHFSPGTMTGLLQKSGFSVISLSHFSLEYNPFGWMQSLLNLCHCSHNFAYNLLKRAEKPFHERKASKRLYDLFGTIIFGTAFVPLSFVFAILESSFHRGGTFTITARKKSESTD
jgi:2-polyprenyl-3-methyl-5-hydroxy-6-metoxy-1,4-benzoquinol methylase